MTDFDITRPPASPERLKTQRRQIQDRITTAKRRSRNSLQGFVAATIVTFLVLGFIFTQKDGILTGSLLIYGLLAITMLAMSDARNKLDSATQELQLLDPITADSDLALRLNTTGKQHPETCRYLAQIAKQGRLPTIREAQNLLDWIDTANREQAITQLRALRPENCPS